VSHTEPPPEMPAFRDPDQTDINLSLRAPPARVVQLSRKVIAGLSCLSALLIAGAFYLGVQNRSAGDGSRNEPVGATQTARIESINNLPKDYGDIPRHVPKLGPPLPGDLGRPMLNAGVAPATPIPGPVSPDPETQRQNQEMEAARLSRLFAPATTRRQTSEGTITPANPAPEDRADVGRARAPADAYVGGPEKDSKHAFLKAHDDGRTRHADRLKAPASPFVIQAGTIIPGALLTGIRSDLPGDITAQVTEHVYDSPSGRTLLIPQGSRLIGAYDSQIAFGQSRVLLVWTRLILPDGKSVSLDRQKGADVAGYSGLEDDVDNHWGSLVKAAAVSTLLSIGSQIAIGNNDNQLQQAVAQGAALGFNQIGRQIIGRSLTIQPTLTVRPGFPVRVMINRDLILEPYKVSGESQ
jgi:type IV secretory pathway VirB10-like protein